MSKTKVLDDVVIDIHWEESGAVVLDVDHPDVAVGMLRSARLDAGHIAELIDALMLAAIDGQGRPVYPLDSQGRPMLIRDAEATR